MRDLNCSLLEIAGLRQIIAEPIIFESAEEQLRVDWMVRGFEHPQKVSLFDCCIVNADSPSLEHLSLFASCDAVFDKEAKHYFRRMAVHLSKKWK